MAEEVKLPELGESVTEAIVTAWLVEVGDTVEVDQPLFEISTDKVDTEVPSPVAGTLVERRAEVDDTIEPGQVIALIGAAGDAPAAAPAASAAAEPVASETPAPEAAAAEHPAAQAPAADAPDADAPAADAPAAAPAAPAPTPAAAPASSSAAPSAAPSAASAPAVAGSDALVSPLVRKLLREAGLTPDQVTGTGEGGRITRADADAAIARGGAGGAAAAARPAAPRRPEPSPTQPDFGGDRDKTIELTRIRKSIARHMLESIQTTAQLTTAVEADMSRVMHVRGGAKGRFKQREGISLSPLPFIARAVCLTIPRHPIVNGRIDTDAGTATFHDYVNLGIAIDTERGLLVPNIKNAQDQNVTQLAHSIADLAERTRGKGLQPDDIAAGTFTITSTGSRGALWDTPILNPPEVAILGAAVIEKRPVVVESELGDSIAIRHMTYLCLTYDHRMVDGADAARFLSDLKWVLENHDLSGEV